MCLMRLRQFENYREIDVLEWLIRLRALMKTDIDLLFSMRQTVRESLIRFDTV